MFQTPWEPERATETREARRSGELTKKYYNFSPVTVTLKALPTKIVIFRLASAHVNQMLLA